MIPEQSEIKKIIKGCKKGDAESFSKLIDAYSTRLYGFFYRLSGNRTTSDELLSELFVKLVERIPTYQDYGGGSFDSWLFAVASNMWYDHLRSKQRQDKALDGRRQRLEEQTRQNQFSRYEEQAMDRLSAELENIDEESRELIMLRYYSQMSFKEIAEHRSQPIGTILSKVHRGLKKLRESMEQNSNE